MATKGNPMSATEETREVVTEFYKRLDAGDTAAATAPFADTVHWDIPGDTRHVPWIGRRHTREDVARFWDALAESLDRELFRVRTVLADGPNAVALGNLRSRVRATGRLIELEFATEFTVNNARITRYVLFEDSWRVAQAVSGE
jgi:ketosteroid isomerase-like protein